MKLAVKKIAMAGAAAIAAFAGMTGTAHASTYGVELYNSSTRQCLVSDSSGSVAFRGCNNTNSLWDWNIVSDNGNFQIQDSGTHMCLTYNKWFDTLSTQGCDYTNPMEWWTVHEYDNGTSFESTGQEMCIDASQPAEISACNAGTGQKWWEMTP
ncbi:hypothetical protein OG455_01820 [Kitasatospora sp. NBC_01287]|uniref:RICIN domain-containing protein n=1 Tax=Kitasatospora sp. NBC_01287 TaxID=2903573 RepID=UPI0022526395|nr:hypothetical protein [Kitasatospora sp. NBC_01287]MCX4744262.1 hypothetical protein [Kitasatospora sp. NBC_01287]